MVLCVRIMRIKKIRLHANSSYAYASTSALSSSGSSIFSQKIGPDLSDDANLDRSHCMKPGIGLRVAKFYREKYV